MQATKPEGKDVLGDFTAKDIDGNVFDLSTLSGKVLAAPSVIVSAIYGVPEEQTVPNRQTVPNQNIV